MTKATHAQGSLHACSGIFLSAATSAAGLGFALYSILTVSPRRTVPARLTEA
jgi:hypothetical protein